MTATGIVLQHDDDVPPALLGAWLDERGLPWQLVQVERDGPPDLDGVSWLAVLGSHHSAGAAEPSWIPREIELLRSAVRRDVPVLGICFGSQALSVALGGEVYPAPLLEARWDDGIEILDELPPGPWLNFHTESFTLPGGANLLARSAAGPSAFRRGPHLGVQFHPEATPEIANAWGERYRRDRREIDAEALARDGEAAGPGAARRAFALFDGWWRRIRDR